MSKKVAAAMVHIEKRRKLESSISELEDRIFVLESSYFEETATFNIVRGWEGFKRAPLSIKKQGGSTRAFDRVLSLSSLTSPCGEQPWPSEKELLGNKKEGLNPTEKKKTTKKQIKKVQEVVSPIEQCVSTATTSNGQLVEHAQGGEGKSVALQKSANTQFH